MVVSIRAGHSFGKFAIVRVGRRGGMMLVTVHISGMPEMAAKPFVRGRTCCKHVQCQYHHHAQHRHEAVQARRIMGAGEGHRNVWWNEPSKVVKPPAIHQALRALQSLHLSPSSV